LLFTKEEVAADITADISGFYRKNMRNPLKSDIEKGASDRRLAAYFSLKELRPSADGSSRDEKRRERDEYQIAVDLFRGWTG